MNHCIVLPAASCSILPAEIEADLHPPAPVRSFLSVKRTLQLGSKLEHSNHHQKSGQHSLTACIAELPAD